MTSFIPPITLRGEVKIVVRRVVKKGTRKSGAKRNTALYSRISVVKYKSLIVDSIERVVIMSLKVDEFRFLMYKLEIKM